jgi:hypothetical protein
MARNALTEARTAAADVEVKLGEVRAKREALLLTGNDRALDKLEDELAALRRQAERAADRVRLLEEEARHAEDARRARERQALIGRIETKLAGRDQAGVELQDALAKAVQAFRTLVRLSRDVDAAWPFPVPDRAPCLLPAGSIVAAIQAEIYRIGTIPFTGGSYSEIAEPSFPGGRVPDFSLAALPEQIAPLVDALHEASEHARKIMRGGVIEPAEHQELVGAT